MEVLEKKIIVASILNCFTQIEQWKRLMDFTFAAEYEHKAEALLDLVDRLNGKSVGFPKFGKRQTEFKLFDRFLLIKELQYCSKGQQLIIEELKIKFS